MTEPLTEYLNKIHCSSAVDFLFRLPDKCIQTIVTSPPYFGLRSYISDESPDKPMEIGLEPTPAAFVGKMVDLFREARRVLRDDGTLWLNLGDTYTGGGRGANPPVNAYWKQGTNTGSLVNTRTDVDGLPPKSLLGIPWRVAFGLQDDGWILRADLIWHKPNPMPESVTDRPTKAHEYVFLFSKQPRYYYDADAIKEPALNTGGSRGVFRGGGSYTSGHAFQNGAGRKESLDVGRQHIPVELRNKRTIWTVPTQGTPDAHFATFPPKLITPMILAGAPVGGVVLDPFMGSGTTALVARQLGRHFIGCDLNPEYVAMANRRLAQPHTPDMFYTLAAAE